MSVIHPLAGNQALAVDPGDTVWLSASAGTGKTQVLSARVLRLLLEPDVRPEQILCLTFTKAGATEMAARINETLARWVRAEPVRLWQSWTRSAPTPAMRRRIGLALCSPPCWIVRAAVCGSIRSTPSRNGFWRPSLRKPG
jgi:superfamily I DNA/RNA helicase